jgi:hypothetical protein
MIASDACAVEAVKNAAPKVVPKDRWHDAPAGMAETPPGTR